MSEDVAIRVEHVSKKFILPHEKTSSLKSLFTGLTKRSKKSQEIQTALKDVTFDVKQGEFFGIVGRNGSGKSTLLKILAGIYQPNSGQVYTKGKLVPFIELGVGFNPELTGRENVYLNGAMLGFSEKEVAAQYQDVVEFAELERFMDQKLKNYSSGMQVRLAFSMAIRAEADILLIDEVLAVGDADFQRKCFNYFSQLKNKKVTVVFISHDISAIREYCDRTMFIDDSRVIRVGDTDDIAQEYLRMFMKSGQASSSDEENKKRWGDKAISTSYVKADVTSQSITVAISIKANQDFSRPIAGFRIRDASGAEITGTNTKKENITLPDISKGKSLKVQWEMPNILRDGEYAVDIALQYPDEISVADWWDDAAVLTVNKERHLPYSIDPGFKVTTG